MKILLIGATGQIGYALTKALSQTAHQTSILVRNAHSLAFPANVNVLEEKAFTADAFRRALRDIDCVIYGIGLPEQFSFDAQLFQRVNYELLETFLDVLQESTVRRLSYISTYEVFRSTDGVIRESHPIADPRGMSPYFRAMIQAYGTVTRAAAKIGLALTTIHPAAVYGGLNTSYGITDVIENLLNWRIWKLPVIIESRFPIIHADSLAMAIVHALDKNGAYIVSDQMTSLRELAVTLRQYARSYVPATLPLWMASATASVLEFFARILKIRPILAHVQIEFLTNGVVPRADRAQEELDWQPMPLQQGLQQYLRDRKRLLG